MTLDRLAYAAAGIGALAVLETQNRIYSPRYPLRDPAQVAARIEPMRLYRHRCGCWW